MTRKRARVVTAAIVSVVIVSVLVAGFVVLWQRYLRPTVIIKPFPDPLLFLNGTRVETPAQWAARRAEISSMMLGIQYGNIPGRPDAIRVDVMSNNTRDDGSMELVIVLGIVASNATPDQVINVTTWLFIPDGDGPFPAIVKVSPDGTGTQEPTNRTVTTQGYVFVAFDHQALDPDTRSHDVDGPAQLAYPDHDWGSLAVWAWGAMRVADFLLGEPWVDNHGWVLPVDPGQLVITGHSRRGKVALLAGALDERFSMVVPNGSGCGGAGSYLVQGAGAETLASITSPERFKSWFHEDFGEFGGKERDLPFDQHFMRALVAPRVVMSTDALGDRWANPEGTQATWEAAQPVFDLLGAPEHNAIHFREGGHAFILDDFNVLIAATDSLVRGIPRLGDFYTAPFTLAIEFEETS